MFINFQIKENNHSFQAIYIILYLSIFLLWFEYENAVCAVHSCCLFRQVNFDWRDKAGNEYSGELFIQNKNEFNFNWNVTSNIERREETEVFKSPWQVFNVVDWNVIGGALQQRIVDMINKYRKIRKL